MTSIASISSKYHRPKKGNFPPWKMTLIHQIIVNYPHKIELLILFIKASSSALNSLMLTAVMILPLNNNTILWKLYFLSHSFPIHLYISINCQMRESMMKKKEKKKKNKKYINHSHFSSTLFRLIDWWRLSFIYFILLLFSYSQMVEM